MRYAAITSSIIIWRLCTYVGSNFQTGILQHALYRARIPASHHSTCAHIISTMTIERFLLAICAQATAYARLHTLETSPARKAVAASNAAAAFFRGG